MKVSSNVFSTPVCLLMTLAGLHLGQGLACAQETTGQQTQPADQEASRERLTLPVLTREMRGAWVATVANIDWPSKKGLSSSEMLAEIKTLVAAAKLMNLNALMLQVRPTCDAIYPSQLEPWSEYVTGLSGKAPDPIDPQVPFDPLDAWIKECHANAIELHAWFNPFRARHFETKFPDAPNHVSNTMPDIVYDYDRFKWMDPGSPKAQDWAIKVMLDVIERYDIDGIHIDDYFYPYPKDKVPFPDDATYKVYTDRGGTLAKDDWRRNQIDQFIARMYTSAKEKKPYLKVGISPFGIWRPGHPEGIDGFDAYAKLHADAKKWLNEGTLDYAAPQLYWAISSPKQSFPKLLDWWISQSVVGRPVIPGIYTSRLDPADAKGTWDSKEIVDQIDMVRSREGTGGVIHFSMKALSKNYKGVGIALASGVYDKPAILPYFESCDTQPPTPPANLHNLVCELKENQRLAITWNPPIDDRVVVVAWRLEDGNWNTTPVSAAAGVTDYPAKGVTHAAIAPLSRAGQLGKWVVFEPVKAASDAVSPSATPPQVAP